jgi:hypothetical protein
MKPMNFKSIIHIPPYAMLREIAIAPAVGTKSFLLWVAFAIFATSAYSQSINCGIYTKPASLGQSGPFYTDRFANSYSEDELRAAYQSSTFMQCGNTGAFNLLIEPTIYQGNTYPTTDQEMVICEVFSYLAGLIEAPGTGGTVNIQITLDPSLEGSGVGGVGTPLFSSQCGIGYSIVQEQLNTQSPYLPTDFIHGYIRINPEYDWYTELDLDPAISNEQVDLYTVVLHEALHVLGFASQIGASGNSLQGFYTLYDLHLNNDSGDPMIESSVSSEECCIEYEFNTTDFPNMPTPILTCGNIEYDVAQTPPVHGQYSFTPPLSDELAANILSHLSIICGSEDYVMHATIGLGASTNGISNIRRELTVAEINILCSLGYDMGTDCEAECFVIVQDDGPFVLNQASETLPYTWLTANDFDAEGNYQIQFDFTCGDVGNLTFSPNGTAGELTITLNSTPFGEYEFCYTIFSCDGELCQSGSVRLIVAEEIDPLVCIGEDCNLVNFGDFELFPPGGNTYYQSFDAPWKEPIIVFSPSNPPSLHGNSVDIYTDGENNYVRMVRGVCDECHQENILVPLCSEIPVQCGINIEFDALVDNILAFGTDFSNITLGVWALSELPDPLELPFETDCNGVLFDGSGNAIGFCVEEVNLTYGDIPYGPVTPPLDFVKHWVNSINTFDSPIRYIWFLGYPVFPYPNSKEIVLDNIIVTHDCQNQVIATPTMLEACIGGQAVIDIEVCLDGELAGSADVTISPNIQGIPGISLSASNPDFPSGTATIEGLAPGECITFTLFLDVSSGFQPDTEITFPFDLEADGACVENPGGQSVTMTVEECENLYCDCPEGSIVIGAPGVETFLSDLVPNTLPATPPFGTPLNITVRGTLVIDANVITSTQEGEYSFPPLSDICMDAGAVIRIPSKNTLNLYDPHIRGCEKRWKSITVMHDATLNLLGDGFGLVEDGQYAVHPQNKSTINIKDTRFNKNYVGLYFNDPLGEFFLQPFFGNRFDCTDNLLPHYDAQAPNDGPWSFAGIHTNGQDFLNVGVAGMAANRFDSLRNGIITNNCNLTLRNSRFNNIQRLDYPTAGHGVLATGAGHTFFQSSLAGNTTFFDNCNMGIFLKGMNANVHNNVMNNVMTGVLVRESPNLNIKVSHNTINCTMHGISLWFNDPAQLIQLNNNAIHVSPPLPDIRAAAIYVRENGAAQPNAQIHLHDDIEIFNAGAGISLIGCNGYKLEQNFIDAAQNATLNYAGISLHNSPNNFLSCNRVNGDYGSNSFGGVFGPAGIKATASKGVEYDCNDVQDTYLGVRFDMDCGNTKFKTTTFNNHRYGLHYAMLGVTGHQPMNLSTGTLHGNIWDGTWGGANAVGARHENPDDIFVNESQYVVRSISAPWGPENPSSASNTWFDDDPNRSQFSCGITCNVWLTGDTSITELDKRIAKGLVDPGVYTEPMQWMLERGLYRKLYANSELVQPYTLLDTFYTEKSTTTIGRFTAAEAAIHALFKPDTSTTGQLQDYYELITEQMEDMALIDSLLQTASGQDSLDLLVQREYALEIIDSLSQLNSALAKSVLQARSAAANSIIVQNNAIAVTDIWEQNEKTVNHIFLNTVAKGISFNNTQSNLLQAIADQCPYGGGTAVFRARALLEIEVDDEAACSQAASQAAGQALEMTPADNQSAAAGIKMYPNPAKDLVTVRMDEALKNDAELSVYNLYGRLAGRHYLSEGADMHSFTTEGLPPGIYLVRIQEYNKVIFSAKLVIVK